MVRFNFIFKINFCVREYRFNILFLIKILRCLHVCHLLTPWFYLLPRLWIISPHVLFLISYNSVIRVADLHFSIVFFVGVTVIVSPSWLIHHQLCPAVYNFRIEGISRVVFLGLINLSLRC